MTFEEAWKKFEPNALPPIKRMSKAEIKALVKMAFATGIRAGVNASMFKSAVQLDELMETCRRVPEQVKQEFRELNDA